MMPIATADSDFKPTSKKLATELGRVLGHDPEERLTDSDLRRILKVLGGYSSVLVRDAIRVAVTEAIRRGGGQAEGGEALGADPQSGSSEGPGSASAETEGDGSMPRDTEEVSPEPVGVASQRQPRNRKSSAKAQQESA